MKKQDGETSRNRRKFSEGRGRRGSCVRRGERHVRTERRFQIRGAEGSRENRACRTEASGSRGTTCRRRAATLIFPGCTGRISPILLKRPGYLWAAHYASQDLEGGAENATRYKHVDDPRVGKGYHYMLLIAAADANVFGDPVPSLINAALPEQGKKMLAMRTGERMNIFTETGRREGRALAAYKEGMTGAPCVQIGSFDCALEFEEEMHAGYVLERLPKMCATPSCVRTRKLNSVAGWAKHGIIYEFASKEGFDRDYAPAVANSPLGLNGRSVVPNLVHAPNGPNSALRIWPPVPKA